MDILNNIDIIGVVGLLIATYTFYRTQIQKGNIKIVVGPSIDLYYASDGGSCFYIPTAFINENDNSANVISVSIKITTPKNITHKLRWADFVNYDAKKRGYNHLDHARSFSVPGQTVIDKYIWFVWRPDNSVKFDFDKGIYNCEMILDKSTSETNKLIHFPFKFEIDQISFDFLKNEKLNELSGTRSITLKGYENENIIE